MEFERVLGLDTSLARTGMASIDLVTRRIQTRALSSSKRGHIRLQWILTSVSLAVEQHDLIAIEKPLPGTKGGGSSKYSHENAGVWWMIKHEVWRQRKPVVLIHNATRAKYACGADKDRTKAHVHAWMAGRFLELPLKTHDEADALALALIAARVAGTPYELEPVGRDRYHPVAPPTIEWP
jgi:Holliday junction resolvasome RuvABC endonuclease subunit